MPYGCSFNVLAGEHAGTPTLLLHLDNARVWAEPCWAIGCLTYKLGAVITSPWLLLRNGAESLMCSEMGKLVVVCCGLNYPP